jgi:hypothetical protein
MKTQVYAVVCAFPSYYKKFSLTNASLKCTWFVLEHSPQMLDLSYVTNLSDQLQNQLHASSPVHDVLPDQPIGPEIQLIIICHKLSWFSDNTKKQLV